MFRNPCISHHPARRDPASSTRPIRTNPPSLSAALPLNLGHASTTEYQRSEFIDQSILAASDRRWQDSPSTSLKEIPLAILLAFQADANERRDCLAHACVPRHLIGDTGS